MCIVQLMKLKELPVLLEKIANLFILHYITTNHRGKKSVNGINVPQLSCKTLQENICIVILWRWYFFKSKTKTTNIKK